MPVIINKAAYCNLKSGIPSNSQLISNRAGWIINVEEGVEGAPNNLIDGKTGTDVALNNKDIIKQILRAIFLNNNINFDKYTTLLYQLITHFFSKHC